MNVLERQLRSSLAVCWDFLIEYPFYVYDVVPPLIFGVTPMVVTQLLDRCPRRQFHYERDRSSTVAFPVTRHPHLAHDTPYPGT